MSTDWIWRAPQRLRERPREAGAISLGVLVAIIAVLSFVPKQQPARWPTAVARRDAFTQALVETGTISAARLMVYSSTIAGAQAKIVQIVPEGTSVKAGDLLVRFETATFEQNLARETAALRQAESELQRTREDVRIETLRVEADTAQAREQVAFAESALTDQLEGRGKFELAEIEAAAAEAGRELNRAKTTFEDMKPLFKEGFVTKAELDRAEQAWQRAIEQQRLAALKREAAVKYQQPAAADRSRSELNAARGGLKRQTETSSAVLAQRQAAVGLAQGRVDEVSARISILRRQIANSTIRADVPGLVVYRDLYFGSDKRKPQVGDEVWPNQPLIALPDMSQLTVETRVREVDLHRLSASQKVTVRVEAYPDLRLPGSIALIGALAQDDATRAGTKYFPVTVRILAGDPRLRTGMTASVEIELASIRDAVVVPAQAVFDRAGQPYAFVMRRGRPEQQRLVVAADNELLAAIGRGVSAGDVVLLVDPTADEARRK